MNCYRMVSGVPYITDIFLFFCYPLSRPMVKVSGRMVSGALDPRTTTSNNNSSGRENSPVVADSVTAPLTTTTVRTRVPTG